MNECSEEMKGNEVNMNTQFIFGRAAAGFTYRGSWRGGGSENTPVVFAQTRWGWSQPGRAPGTAGGLHTQTDCLARSVLGQGPPRGPG